MSSLGRRASVFRPLRKLAERRREAARGGRSPEELRVRGLELELAAARERARRLYEEAPIGYLTLDRDGVIVDANPMAAALLRQPRARLVGRELARIVAPPDLERWRRSSRALGAGSEPRSLQLDFALPGGGRLHAQLVRAGSDDGDEPAGTVRLALLDRGELRRLACALREAAMAAALAEQRERRSLASDLHDDAGQLLTLATLKLRALAAALGEAWAGEVRELDALLCETRRRLTSLTFQLSPPLLHEVGLVAAARWLAAAKERRWGLAVPVEAGEELALDEATRVTLFRALRELLVNAAKHAGTGEARVRIWREGGLACVAVEDEGVGFDPAAAGRGFGLLALRERVAGLGGHVEIDSAAGRGTRVVVSVPAAPGGDGDAP